MTSENMSGAKRRERLLAQLADGNFHSGEVLAKRMRVSRSAVWKVISSLRELGIEVQAVQKQGYRLPKAVDLYDAADIENEFSSEARQSLERIDVLLQVDSTNHYLSSNTPPELGRAALCVAETQTAGRGRRGRSWTAPFGTGICMSLAWTFAESPPTFSALSLAVGVAIARVLRAHGANDVKLKWPNDIVWQARKLGGILIEMRGESVGPSQIVIGLGLNMRMPAQVRLELAKQQATLIADLYEILRDRTPTRNVLVAAITTELLTALQLFSSKGFGPFRDAWHQLDSLANVPVRVLSANEVVEGIARGVASDGALLVDVAGQQQRFVSGDVSLRAAKV
jgi:BirA family biotin operon repressor/biotin-[acetyl-CoA-carboxylase] ligase